MNRWPLAWWHKKGDEPRELRLTINEGRTMVLRDPFNRIAIFDGAVKLWSDGGAMIEIPSEGRAYITGIIADDEVRANAR